MTKTFGTEGTSVIGGVTSGGEPVQFVADNSFSQVSIEHAHHMVHDGLYYRSGMNFTLANGQVATFGLTTPNSDVKAHLTIELTASADGTLSILENVTSFSGGASVTPLNHNRNSSNTSTIVCISGMTDSNLITPTGGTQIIGATLSTGKGATITRDTGAELILKKNTKYLFKYTNGTSTNVIQLILQWYEEED